MQPLRARQEMDELRTIRKDAIRRPGDLLRGKGNRHRDQHQVGNRIVLHARINAQRDQTGDDPDSEAGQRRGKKTHPKFDRHGAVSAPCPARSGPDSTYNCAFQRRFTGAILMFRRPALTKLPHQTLVRARQLTDDMRPSCPQTANGHHADTGA